MLNNWQTWYLKGPDSKSGHRFAKFLPKMYFRKNLDQKVQNCPFHLKIGTYAILEDLILNPELDL